MSFLGITYAYILLFSFLGNEEIEMACSSSLTSWIARSALAIQLDVISCIASDLKEK